MYIFFAYVINKIHTLVLFYIIFGFLYTPYLKWFLCLWPFVLIQWYILSDECILTIIEKYLRKQDKIPKVINIKHSKLIEEGFVSSFLANFNIHLSYKLRKILCYTIPTISWIIGIYRFL